MSAPTGPTLDVAGAEALLRRLELTVRHRLDGLLQGNYAGLVPGPGTDPGEVRQYVAGDDVRRMDWPVTARTTTPTCARPSPTANWRPGWSSTCRPAWTSARRGPRSGNWYSRPSPRSCISLPAGGTGWEPW